jgi:lysophospholipase L1-like esterase
MAFSLLVTLAFFAGVEGVLRIVGVEPPRERPRILLRTQDIDITFPFMRPDRELFWSLAPGFRGGFLGQPVQINGLGLRGEELARPKPARRKRVACFGDSITFGYGVADSETYPYRLGQALAPRRAEVVNAGVTGYTTHQVLRLLRRLAPDLEADVATFCIGWNDQTRRALTDREYARKVEASLPLQTRLDGLYLFRALRNYALRRELAAIPERADKERVPLPEYRENLEAIVKECRARQIEPVFIALPRRKKKGEPPFESAYLDALRETARRLEVPVLACGDLGLTTSRESNEEFFLDLLHLTVAGNERMARELAVQLAALGVV